MRIGSFSLNSDNEVIVKVVREVLNLFKLEITQEQPDYQALQVQNEILPTQPVSVRTEVWLYPLGAAEPVTELLEQQAQQQAQQNKVNQEFFDRMWKIYYQQPKQKEQEPDYNDPFRASLRSLLKYFAIFFGITLLLRYMGFPVFFLLF